MGRNFSFGGICSANGAENKLDLLLPTPRGGVCYLTTTGYGKKTHWKVGAINKLDLSLLIIYRGIVYTTVPILDEVENLP